MSVAQYATMEAVILDRLRTIESFARVMRSGSFSLAARQLGISRALVSRHIQDLERHLGIQLLIRTTRNMTPTQEAIAYLETCEHVFAELERGRRAIREEKASLSGTLSIVAPKSSGATHLADAVLDFAKTEPNMQVSLFLEDFFPRVSQFLERGFDLALSLSAVKDPDLHSKEVTKLEWVLCATPDYLRRNGVPRSPAELKRHLCLTHINLDPSEHIWRFIHSGSRRAQKISGPFLSNSVLVLRKAVLRSSGIAQLPLYAVSNDLSRGTLVELMPRFRIPPRALRVLYPNAKADSPKIARFVLFLADWLEKEAPSQSA